MQSRSTVSIQSFTYYTNCTLRLTDQQILRTLQNSAERPLIGLLYASRLSRKRKGRNIYFVSFDKVRPVCFMGLAKVYESISRIQRNVSELAAVYAHRKRKWGRNTRRHRIHANSLCRSLDETHSSVFPSLTPQTGLFAILHLPSSILHQSITFTTTSIPTHPSNHAHLFPAILHRRISIILSSLTPCDPSRILYWTSHLSHLAPWRYHCETKLLVID